MINLIHFEIKNGNLSPIEYGTSVINYSVGSDIFISYRDLIVSCGESTLLNAILVRNERSETKVFVDQYGSIPMFYLIQDDRIIFSNIFDRIASACKINTVDEVGFWESFLFETPFLERTLFDNIKIIQAGHYLSIIGKSVTQKPYFKFKFGKLQSKNFIEDAFNSLVKNTILPLQAKQIVFPISGGVDSRLLLGLFKRKAGNSFILPVTYGYGRSSLEYQYARRSLDATKIPYDNHQFHKLDANTYLENTDHLIKITGGLIGAQNSHFFSYLNKNEFSDEAICISGFFADSIFGYAAGKSKERDHLDNKYFRTAKDFYEAGVVPEMILQKIKEDLLKLYQQYQESNLDTFDEFIYIKERTTKFHIQLYNLYRTQIDVQMPLLQNDIIDCFMGIPSAIRRNKDIIFKMLDTYFVEFKDINNISSSGRYGSGKGQGMTKINYFTYIALTTINKILVNKLKIPINLDNPYDTEKQDFYYLKNFKKVFITDLVILERMKLLNSSQSKVLSKRVDGMRNLQIITNTDLYEKYIKLRT